MRNLIFSPHLPYLIGMSSYHCVCVMIKSCCLFGSVFVFFVSFYRRILGALRRKRGGGACNQEGLFLSLLGWLPLIFVCVDRFDDLFNGLVISFFLRLRKGGKGE